MKKTFFLIFIALLCLPIFVYAVTVDNNGPILSSISYTDNITECSKGDKIYLDLVVKDEVSGVSTGMILYHSVDSNDYFYTTIYDINDKPFVIIPNNVKSNTFIIYSIDLIDKASNSSRYAMHNDNAVHFEESYFDFSNTLLKINGDEQIEFKPIIKNIYFDKTEVNGGDTIKISVETDQTKVLRTVVANISSISNGVNINDRLNLYYEPSTGYYAAKYVAPQNDGDYFISFVSLENDYRDMYVNYSLNEASNSQTKYFCEKGTINCTLGIYKFVVSNSQNDVTAPVVEQVELSKKSFSAPSLIDIFVTAKDDISGISKISAELYKVDSNGKIDLNTKKVVNLSYDELTKKYKANIVFDQYSISGKYVIFKIEMVDNAGNTSNSCLNKCLTSTNIDMNDLKYGYFEIVDEFKYDVTTSTIAEDLIEKIQSASDNAIIMIDGIQNTIVPKEVFDTIKNTNKTIYVESNGIQWIWNGKDIVNETKNIDTKLITSIFYDENLGDDENYISLEFQDNGLLPGKAKVRIKAEYTFRYSSGYDSLYVYFHDGDIYYETAKGIGMTEDGYYEFEINHNSVYVMSNKEVPKELVSDAEYNVSENTKGDNSLDKNNTINEKNKDGKDNKYLFITAIIISTIILIFLIVLIQKKVKINRKNKL